LSDTVLFTNLKFWGILFSLFIFWVNTHDSVKSGLFGGQDQECLLLSMVCITVYTCVLCVSIPNTWNTLPWQNWSRKHAHRIVINNQYPKYSTKSTQAGKLVKVVGKLGMWNYWTERMDQSTGSTGSTMTYIAIRIWVRPDNWQTNLRKNSTTNYIYMLLQ